MAPRTSLRDLCLRCQTRRLVQQHILRAANLKRNQRYQSTRPPTAPKQTPNTKHVRQNVELYRENCIARNYQAQSSHPAKIRELSEELAHVDQDLKLTREARNSAHSGGKKSQPAVVEQDGQADREVPSDTAKALKEQYHTLKKKGDALLEQIQSLALTLPNLTSRTTPTNSEPNLLEYLNYDPSASSVKRGKSHVEIGTHLSLLDFTSSSVSTGWGWYFLLNDAVLLEQALINHALTIGARHGFRPVSPPSIVYSHMAEACGFSPRDQNNEQQIYHLTQPPLEDPQNNTKPQRSLAATAEIPLAAMHAGHEIPESSLPIKLIGPSRCYRAESGARGLDTKGLYRVHEFTKVEMFAWTSSPDASDPTSDPTSESFAAPATQTFTEMLAVQKAILSPLGLPLRILEMPATDLGASAYRKIDIETFFPSRYRPDEHDRSSKNKNKKNDGWGELSSLSICTDYQARRLGTRVRGADGGRKKFAHTVNGTAVAVPRVLAALLEWGWREVEGKKGGGYVVVPECLRGWMGGRERIEA